MKDHYGLTDAQYDWLLAKGVTMLDLVKSVKEFKAETVPVSTVSLMYFIDTHGDFSEGSDKLSLIAQAVFNSLPSAIQKRAVMEYVMHMEGEE